MKKFKNIIKQLNYIILFFGYIFLLIMFCKATLTEFDNAKTPFDFICIIIAIYSFCYLINVLIKNNR